MESKRTNYYDNVKSKINIVDYDKTNEDMFLKANENPDDWIILIDGDVDFVTIFDKKNKIAYPQQLKGYELLTANVIGYVEVEYAYIEEYFEKNKQI